MNAKTPAAGTARAIENVCSAADDFQIAPDPRKIQIAILRSRFGLTADMAATVAAHAFASPETWRSAR